MPRTAAWGSENWVQMASEVAVFPAVSAISDNVENSTRVLHDHLTSIVFENARLICGCGESSTRFLSGVLRLKPLHQRLYQMASWVYTNHPFHQLMDLSSAVDSSLLDNIFVIQGSSTKVLFIDNSTIMDLDCAAHEAVIFATTPSLRSRFGRFLGPIATISMMFGDLYILRESVARAKK
ncbi:hypothetical protein DFH08DRAFT_797010 [Mycena albidolilacea]|uniref:Uncharacterized protein n=1 Tax=Mycena albidolilacea TaxID=1033008 RepID=A0AAD7AW93_9AGAR|nr:hypothetical protein DFH08DRAFT_797010 [Mycena albidolilacea]